MKRIILTLALLTMSFGASAMVVYQNDFNSGDSTGWSGGYIDDGVYKQQYDPGSQICGFLGCITIGAGFDPLNFSHEHPAQIGSVDIMFDVITYGNWEQSGGAKDEFSSVARIWGLFNDETIYEGTLNDGVNSMMISNVPLYGGPEFLGGNANLLSLKFDADVSAESVEYFGIDNFKVIANGAIGALPEPGTLAIFLVGLAGIAASRRRA